MKKFSTTLTICLSLFLSGCASDASTFKARFQPDRSIATDGIRFAEFRTSPYDVFFKVSETTKDSITFKIYISNIGKEAFKVSSTLFNIISAETKKTYSAIDPEALFSFIDKGSYLTKASLAPGESAGGLVKFKVKNSTGNWVLKNKLTAHAFNFDVQSE